MRKVTTTVAAALVAFSFAACNKTNNSAAPEVAQGNTYASLTISTKGPLRAEVDNIGRDAEGAVKGITLLSTDPVMDFTKENTDFKKSGDYYKTKAFKTTAGTRPYALIINKGSLAMPALVTEAPEYLSAAGKMAADYASDDNGFVMTSEVKSFEVKKNISEEDVNALNAPDAKTNGFQLDVERVVAQGVVVNGATANSEGGYTTTDNLGDLSSLKYGGAMGAKQTYVFGNNKGKREMSTANKYEGFTSSVDNVVTTASYDDDETTDAENRAKFQLAEKTDLALVTDWSDYSSKLAKRGFYFFENSVKNPSAKANLGAHRNAYAKVYGVYTPKTVMKATFKFVAEEGTGKYFDPETGASKDQDQGGKEGRVEVSMAPVENFATGTTFFLGEQDQVFYDSAASAAASKSAPGQKAYMYKDGKCVYRMPWNQVKSGETTIYADTRRNNIYVLKVTAFEKVGMNYDPNDEEDPNIPKPNNPDEPTTPPDGGDPSWDKAETFAAFFTQAKPWNVVDRDVTLSKH